MLKQLCQTFFHVYHDFKVLVDLNAVFRSVDKTQFQLFHPTVEDMTKAEKLFCSTTSHRIDYYVSAERMEHAPALTQPEVSSMIIISLSFVQVKQQELLPQWMYVFSVTLEFQCFVIASLELPGC